MDCEHQFCGWTKRWGTRGYSGQGPRFDLLGPLIHLPEGTGLSTSLAEAAAGQQLFRQAVGDGSRQVARQEPGGRLEASYSQESINLTSCLCFPVLTPYTN